jgi:hypothetical protein
MPNHAGPNTKGEENLVFSYDLGDVKNSYEGPPTQNYAHQNVANCSSTSGWDGTSVHTQYGLTRTFGVQKDGKTTMHVMYSPNDTAGTSYPTFRLKSLNGTNVQTNGGEVFYLTFEWKSEGAQYLVEGSDRYNLSTFYGNGWKTGSHMITEDLGSVAIGNGWYKRTVKYIAAEVAGQTPLMRFGSGYKRTQGGIYQLWVANVAMTSNHPAGTWLPGQSIRSATEGLKDLTANLAIDLTNVSFENDAQMTFDGTDDTVALGDSSQFNITSSMSVFAWIKPENISGWKGIFGGATSGFVHFQLYNGGINVYVYGPAAAYGNPDSVSIGTNVWTNVGFTFGDNTLRVYLNGEQLPTVVTGNGANISSNSDVRFGWAYATSRLFQGKINALTLHNRALTASEIQANYNAIKGRFNI